jgi:hypothetical protein
VLKVGHRSSELLDKLNALVQVEDCQLDGADTITYRTTDPVAVNPAVVRAAVEAGVDVHALGEAANSLEEAYLRLLADASVQPLESRSSGAGARGAG